MCYHNNMMNKDEILKIIDEKKCDKKSIKKLEQYLLNADKKTKEQIDLYLCLLNNMHYENKIKEEGYKIIAGIDEVGRGPLIGPVVACACVLKENFNLEGLTDSKKISEKKREKFYDYLINNTYYGIGIISPEIIDEVNIYEASKLAMLKALEELRTKIEVDYVITDAMPLDIDIPTKAIIKGDLKSRTISAASVIAKVVRDRMMIELDKEYPMYGFKNHKGYPTKKHVEAIYKYGLIDGYRKTYSPIKEIIKENKNGN